MRSICGPQPSRSGAAEGDTFDIGRLQVSAALYARWLIICRTYTNLRPCRLPAVAIRSGYRPLGLL